MSACLLYNYSCMKTFTADAETIWYSFHYVSTLHPPPPPPPPFFFHSTPSYSSHSLFLSISFLPHVFSVPSAPTVKPGLCTVVVWGSPSQSNGVLTGYDLRFYDEGQERIVNKSNSSKEILHIVQDKDIPTIRERTFVQVSMYVAVTTTI